MTDRIHVHDGLCFARMPDGSVQMLQVEGADPLTSKAVVWNTVVQAGMWASIIAHVSADGDSPLTRAEALERHHLRRTLLLQAPDDDEITRAEGAPTDHSELAPESTRRE